MILQLPGGLFRIECHCEMSAFGTKRTFAFAAHMSAFGGKADIGYCTAHVRF